MNSTTCQNGLERLLVALTKVKKTGKSSYLACCPAHDDKSPSLSIRQLDDGKILLHCFSGCSFDDVVQAAGVDMATLFPAKTPSGVPIFKRAFNASDVLRALAFESFFVLLVAKGIRIGKGVTESDFDRLLTAVGRIEQATEIAGVRHG